MTLATQASLNLELFYDRLLPELQSIFDSINQALIRLCLVSDSVVHPDFQRAQGHPVSIRCTLVYYLKGCRPQI